MAAESGPTVGAASGGPFSWFSLRRKTSELYTFFKPKSAQCNPSAAGSVCNRHSQYRNNREAKELIE